MKSNPDDPKFIEAVKKMAVGDTLKVDNGTLTLEAKFTKPTHFSFHQRIFPAGVILKLNDSNIRIFVEAEKLGMKPDKVKAGEFVDKQIDSKGKILPADRGLDRTKVKEK